jgi:hypothetical protein
MIQSRIDRFTDKTSPSGCWLWTRAKNAKGYGIFSGGLVHRAAYSQFVGPIPEGKYVLHKCDVRCCCNPEHLYAGTQKENVRDMHSRGRANTKGQRPGAAHSLAKITEEDAMTIISMAKFGHSKIDLAATFGVSVSQIKRIASGERWKHLPR